MASESTRPSVEVNPYAAPQVGDPQEAFAEAGVGAWREGNLIVIHCQATLPLYCVVTGEPADDKCYAPMVWPNAVARRQHQRILRVPLSALVKRAYLKPFWWGTSFFFALASIILVLVLATPWFSAPPARSKQDFLAIGLCLLAYGAWIALAFWTNWRFSTFLRSVAVYGDYVWLRGADPGFLNRLPQWPHGK